MYNDKYYLFATFRGDSGKRGTSILVSDKPDNGFVSLVGYAMLFKDMEGHLMISYHATNSETEWVEIREESVNDGYVEIVNINDKLIKINFQ